MPLRRRQVVQLGIQEGRHGHQLRPVGAILEKRVGFDVPIGRRKYEVKSVRDRALDQADGSDAP